MRKTDVRSLFDYNYWANWKILAVTAEATPEQFTGPRGATWRNLRDTLVHTLDVEQSWRRRLLGEDKSVWDAELRADQFATVGELEAFWRIDSTDMRAWLDGLDDEQLAATVDLGPRDRFPLWFFLVHIVTHGTEQRRDVSTMLTNFGYSAPELEFLWYADLLG